MAEITHANSLRACISVPRQNGISHDLLLEAAEVLDRFEFVLGEIARGRCDCGRPLAAETSRQMAREVLSRHGYDWPKSERKR